MLISAQFAAHFSRECTRTLKCASFVERSCTNAALFERALSTDAALCERALSTNAALFERALWNKIK